MVRRDKCWKFQMQHDVSMGFVIFLSLSIIFSIPVWFLSLRNKTFLQNYQANSPVDIFNKIKTRKYHFVANSPAQRVWIFDQFCRCRDFGRSPLSTSVFIQTWHNVAMKKFNYNHDVYIYQSLKTVWLKINLWFRKFYITRWIINFNFWSYPSKKL